MKMDEKDYRCRRLIVEIIHCLIKDLELIPNGDIPIDELDDRIYEITGYLFDICFEWFSDKIKPQIQKEYDTFLKPQLDYLNEVYDDIKEEYFDDDELELNLKIISLINEDVFLEMGEKVNHEFIKSQFIQRQK